MIESEVMMMDPKTEKTCCGCCAPRIANATLVDPVCGMAVTVATAPKYEYEGRSFSFCGDECLKRFQNAPARYAA